ncbi:hypothetical protein AGMMS49574_10500 [Bacteroidia bacterium]|nr:hypothetical protein AGMMS49574_10500 [Bacteroidia bacterium]GHU09154.1 hypothetical protein FACS189431_6720 [Alphaproteobacteria bacterium]
MTQIILKNQIDQSQLDILLYLFRSWNIEAEIDETTTIEKKAKRDTSLTLSVGLWEGRDINDKRLRDKAWGTNKRQIR